MSYSPAHVVLLVGAGFLAGLVNAAAGGGSLVSFPALLIAGGSALAANVTNTVALSFGYAGGVSGYQPELRGQGRRILAVGVAAGLGSLVGVAVLLSSSARVFTAVVPWLLILSCVLLGIQPRVAAFVRRRVAARRRRARGPGGLELSQFLAGAYGAYFGAGLGVMVLALLGIFLPEPLQRLNALKAFVTLTVNVLAAVCFLFLAPVHWLAVALLGPASLLGGRAGARLARRLAPGRLRAAVILLGLGVAGYLLA